MSATASASASVFGSGFGFDPKRPRYAGLTLIVGAHVALLWALLGLGAAPLVLRHVAPIMVALVHTTAPALAPEQPLVVPPPKVPVPMPAPPPPLPAPRVAESITVQALPPAAQPAPLVAPLEVPPPTAPAAVVPAPVVTPPPAPPPRKQIPASALRYLVEPPAERTLVSKRAGESGRVHLRVVIDSAGLPMRVSVHKSSGYARLDEQAVSAMRQARFTPYLDAGQPVEVEVIAAIEYPAD